VLLDVAGHTDISCAGEVRPAIHKNDEMMTCVHFLQVNSRFYPRHAKRQLQAAVRNASHLTELSVYTLLRETGYTEEDDTW
jgi:hypothetical protein